MKRIAASSERTLRQGRVPTWAVTGALDGGEQICERGRFEANARDRLFLLTLMQQGAAQHGLAGVLKQQGRPQNS